jgi:DNA-binding transcriptional LysR family regulator
MRRTIDLALFRALISVAETGGMTSAARSLNLTQAAVSQQIRRLEELFETQIFNRENKRPELTPCGERLVAYARRMLALNDEVWSMMSSPDFEGEIKLGVPHDIVQPFVPPILRSFNQHWPRVRITLVCRASYNLLKMLDANEIDLALATDPNPGQLDKLLLPDQLVWVGARDGVSHRQRPLPVTFGDATCTFRPPAMEALGKAGIDWRLTCETSDYSPYCATLEADLAVAPMLSSNVPGNLKILGQSEGLPALPIFYINLHLPRNGVSEIALEMARYIRSGFALPQQSNAA